MSQFVVNSGNAKRLHSPPSTSKFHSPTALESSISPVKKRRKYNFITREPCFVRRKEHKTGCLAAPENQPWPIGSQEPYVTVPQATDLLISPDFNHPRDIFTSVFSFWMRGINLYPERRKKERKERRKRKKEKEEIPYPVTMCALETFKALDAFEARSDDIVLASYPKCGSNWILHIVRELLSVVSEKKYEYSEFPVLECGDSEKYQRMKLFPSPRIMTTHLHYDKLPGSIIKSKAKNLATGIKQIAEFLGFCLAGEQIQTISAQSTFQAMQAKSQETHGAVGPFLFRKGEVGDWKNLFSETQSQEMDEKFKTCLAGTPLGTKLKYELYCHT